jgi:UDP-N-acetylglucosamine 1-carboxyvinyltransferase
MDSIVVRRSAPLAGRVAVSGAKNSVLKLMAASILADGTSTIDNVPGIADVAIMSELLEAMGLRVHQDPAAPTRLQLERPATITPVAPYELVERIRASIVVLGPLLARCGEAKVSLPGGDDFGPRPIDMHLKGLEALGARFELQHGYLEAKADHLFGADITLEFPSVGATENVLMAAVHARGTTVLENAAREPEIADLCHFLQGMGAKIEGVGTSILIVHGVEPGSLHPVQHRVVPDRVEAATFLAAAAITGGELDIVDARVEHMDMLLRKVGEMGVKVTPTEDGIHVRGPKRLRSVDVATLPYPGVPPTTSRSSPRCWPWPTGSAS